MELEDYLYNYFGYRTFRGKQKELIEHLLKNHDLIVSIPTGAGKSLIFQLAGLLKSGITIVITPLIALMIDQVNQLKENNIRACAFYSSLSEDEKRKQMLNIDSYKFIYITPERFNLDVFREKLINVSLVVIDEAHTILWGKDFRKSFLQIGNNIQKFKKEVTICAFSATLNYKSLLFIKSVLKLKHPYLYYEYPIKNNLEYHIINLSKYKLEELLEKFVNKKVIIYTVTIKNTLNLYQQLKNKFNVLIYHGELDKDLKDRNQRQFKENLDSIMICTNSFGMGINEKNIRLIILYDIPLTLDDLLQQVGRAGRDNLKSDIVINVNEEKIKEIKNFIINNGIDVINKIKEFDKVIEFIYSYNKNKIIKKYYKY